MALAYDTTTIDSFNGSTSNTHSHTCTGSNLVLYVWVSCRFNQDEIGAGDVTYGGVAMTELARVDSTGGTPTNAISLWRLIAPASGANNVIASWSPDTRVGHVIAMSFNGAHQTTPEGTVVTGGDASGPDNLVVTSAVGEIVADARSFLNDDGTSTLTVGADQTERANATVGTPTGCLSVASTEPGAATVTMSWTPDGADDWAGIAVPVKPAAAVTARPSRLMVLGAA